MSDIRQSTTIRDDFERTDENPIEFTTEHPWVTPFILGSPVALLSGALTDTNIFGAYAYWFADPQSDAGGGVPEGWGRVGASYAFPLGTRQGLFTTGGDGYAVLETGGFNIILRRYDGGTFTDISGSVDAGSILPAGFTSNDCLQLMRLTATHLELWRTTDPDDDTTWEFICSVPDTNYRSDLYLSFGATGQEDGWVEIGGGPRPPFVPQIYRRIYVTPRRLAA